MPMMAKFFEIFPVEFEVFFYGVDIIVDTSTGIHYFVDCNYLANYENIPKAELTSQVDIVLKEQIQL